jgi:uncharacterized protein (TIGR00369 family)
MRLDPNPNNRCFGCGGANDKGMKLAFEADEERQRIIGRFRIGSEYEGGSGFLHGGIIALLLDEAMGKASRFYGIHVVTAELSIEYLKPIPSQQEITVEGFILRREGRQLYHEGEIRNADGVVLARGHGRFVEIDPEKHRRGIKSSAS